MSTWSPVSVVLASALAGERVRFDGDNAARARREQPSGAEDVA